MMLSQFFRHPLVLLVLALTSGVIARPVAQSVQSVSAVATSTQQKEYAILKRGFAPLLWIQKLGELTANRFRESASLDTALWSTRPLQTKVKATTQPQIESTKQQKKKLNLPDTPCSTAVTSS